MMSPVTSDVKQQMLRFLCISGVILFASAILVVRVLAQTQPQYTSYCSNTAYGYGVTCINGAGAGGADANITSRTVDYSPVPGNAVIVSAYTCADSKCQLIPLTTLAIGDNINNPEPCFVRSPHSPFSLIELVGGKQKLQEYIWMCPNAPGGVTSFTATCSKPNACSYITLTVTEWTGLASTQVFDTDGGQASAKQGTQATVYTWSPTTSPYDLIYTFLDNTKDEMMSSVPPYRIALQFYPGNTNTAFVTPGTGVQTAMTTWQGKDDWYGTIVAIRSAHTQPSGDDYQGSGR